MSVTYSGTQPLGKWMQFAQRFTPGRKTDLFEIYDRHGGILGIVKWYARWRQYTFHPMEEIVLNAGCMKDIAGFIEKQMQKRQP